MTLAPALFASSFHPHTGGVEEMVRQLAHQQVRNGDRPLIVTNRWPKSLPSIDSFEGLPVRRHAFRVPGNNLRQTGGAYLFGLGAFLRTCKSVRAHRADLIHVNCVSSNAAYAMWVKKLTGIPLVVTLHAELTMDANRLFQKNEGAKALMRRALHTADHITACSKRTLADAEEFLGHSLANRATVVYNGANFAEADTAVPYPYPRRYFLFAGRLVPQKGADVLLRAFAATKITTHDLLIAGDGDQRETLESLASELKVTQRVRFLGRADRAMILSLFKGADAFILPSTSDEGLPMVLLEAMAAGKPAIASAVGGVPELVLHKETGLLVPCSDIHALASALLVLADSPSVRAALGVAASARRADFAWPAIAAQYNSVYTVAIERAGNRQKVA